MVELQQASLRREAEAAPPRRSLGQRPCPDDVAARQAAVHTLLEALGEDPTREGLLDTPKVRPTLRVP